MASEVVMALYRPHAGADEALRALIARHMPTLRRLDLLTERESVLLRAANGTYVEIFEWRDEAAARSAHDHAEVGALWDAMAEVADFVSLETLDEAKKPFTHFTPVSLDD